MSRFWNRQKGQINWNIAEEKDAPDSGLYFLLSRGTTPKVGLTANTENFHYSTDFKGAMEQVLTIINAAKDTEYTIDDVYAIDGHDNHHMKKSDDWTNVFDLARECLPSFRDVVTTRKRYHETQDVLGILDVVDNDHIVKQVKELKPTSKFRKLFELVQASCTEEVTTVAQDALDIERKLLS